MEENRSELSQKALEKMESFFKCMRNNVMGNKHDFHGHGHMAMFSDLELSRRQIFFLFIIAKSQDGVSVKDMARFAHVTSGAVSQFIDSLIQKNLVQRVEDTIDRRSFKVILTDYAKSRINNLKKGYFNQISPVFDNLTTEELKTFVNLLEKMTPSE